MTTTGSASVSNNALQLTDGKTNEAGSAFYSTPVDMAWPFTTDFTFQLTSPDPSVPIANIADGFTFAILTESPIATEVASALGNGGYELGFGGILVNKDLARFGYDLGIKFDLHDNTGEGNNSTGLYLNGAPPTTPSINLNGTGINLHSGNPIKAHITYDGYSALTLTLSDTVTRATWSHIFAINIANVDVGNQVLPSTDSFAFLGFTGSTGGKVAKQQILNWAFTSSNPNQ